VRHCAKGKLDLLGLWGDVGAVQCGDVRAATRQIMSASLDARAGRVPSLALFHAPASRLERSAGDLFGIEFTGLPIHGRGSTMGAGPCITRSPNRRARA